VMDNTTRKKKHL